MHALLRTELDPGKKEVANGEMLCWLQQGYERQLVLRALVQPMTADQLARRVEKTRVSVSDHIRQMRIYGVVVCLNPQAHQSRVYWLTEPGLAARKHLFGNGLSEDHSPVDWNLYGDVCFRHRRAVLTAIRDRMRPPQVKRRALANDALLRMSVDNCREVLHWMNARGLVRTVRHRRDWFAHYELTEVGKACQRLLNKAATPFIA